MASTKAAGKQPSDCDICVKKSFKRIQYVDDYSFWNWIGGRSDFRLNTYLIKKKAKQNKDLYCTFHQVTGRIIG